MSTLADILIPLAGSISNERAIKMREACDALEAKIDIAQRGMNHANDLISLLTDRVKELERDNLDRRLTKLESAVDVLDRERVETLKLRVNGLESMVLELKDATKNIALHTDETLRAVRGGGCTCTHEKRLHANATDGCLVSGCRCETYTGEGRAEEALSGNGRDQERAQPVRAAPPGAQALDVAGEGREPSRQAAPSPAPSVPAPATGEVREQWVDDRLGLELRIVGSDVFWRIPDYGNWHLVKDTGDVGDAIRRRLIAIRAPAAPAVDVRRLLADYWMPALESNMDNEERMTRALAAQGVKCKEAQP